MWFATEGSDGVGDAGSDVIGKKVYGGGWGRRWERWGREGGGGGFEGVLVLVFPDGFDFTWSPFGNTWEGKRNR